jgi:hypothetical protein
MAQDFYAAFSLGEDERYIGTLDADGVALAAIQGLYAINQEQTEVIENLKTENSRLKAELDSVDYRLDALERKDAVRGINLPGIFIGALLAGVVGFAAPTLSRRFS